MEAIFYEIEHALGTGHFLFERNTNHSFPLHMHRCFEMVMMTDGVMNIRVEKEEYTLRKGELLLIKPNHIHSYDTPEGVSGNCVLCVFSSDLIASISEPLTKYKLPHPVLRNIDPLYGTLFQSMKQDSDIATVKGFLYLLCGLFYRQIDFTTEDEFTGDTLLLRDIFIYIENNIDKPCTLNGLAKELKYNESYLSRFFMKSVGITYYEYVRTTKINHACQLLRDTDESVLSIGMQCGYVSPGSFDRCFKQIMGVSPSKYRTMERTCPTRL